MRFLNLILAIVSFVMAIALSYYTSVTVCVDYMDLFAKYGSSCPVYFSVISAGLALVGVYCLFQFLFVEDHKQRY